MRREIALESRFSEVLRALWLCVAIVLLLVATSTLAHSQDRTRVQKHVVHPTVDNIPVITDPSRILHVQPHTAFIDLARLDSVVIGVNEGERSEMFGVIADVKMTPEGVFVLDSKYSEVRVYGYDGVWKSSFGSAGKGPGEFLHPRQLAVAQAGATVYVITGDRRTSVFEQTDSGAFQLKKIIAEGVPTTAGCTINGSLYLLGYIPDSQGIIHRYSPLSEYRSSFAAPYKSPNPTVVGSLSRRGFLACSEQHRLVGLIRENIPVFTAYTENGEIAWQVKFADFTSYVVEETLLESGVPAIGYRSPTAGQSMFTHMFVGASGDFYVQYFTVAEHGPWMTHLFRINAASGEGQYLGDMSQIRAVDADHVLIVRRVPFPQVVIYKRN